MIGDPYTPFRDRRAAAVFQHGLRQSMQRNAEQEALRLNMAQTIKNMDRGGFEGIGGASQGLKSLGGAAEKAAPMSLTAPVRGVPTQFSAPGPSALGSFLGKAAGPVSLAAQAFQLPGQMSAMTDQMKQLQGVPGFKEQMGPALGHDALKQGLVGLGSGASAGAALGPIGSAIGGTLGALMGAAPSLRAGQQTLGAGDTAKQVGLGGTNAALWQQGGNKAATAAAQGIQGSETAARAAPGLSTGAKMAALGTGPFALMAFTPAGRKLFGKGYKSLKKAGKSIRSGAKKLGRSVGL